MSRVTVCNKSMSSRCRILIIEDNDQLRDLLNLVCEEEGFVVLNAGNAPEGAEQIRLDGFDAVIIDITLPGREDGFDLANRAAATPVGVILISGNPKHFERMENSSHAWLRKPFRLDQLLALLDEVMTKTGHECWHWHKRRHREIAR